MSNIRQFLSWRGLYSESFTSNGTFVVPDGVTAVFITAVGGGGGGGGAGRNTSSTGASWGGGGGGSGAGPYRLPIQVTPGANISVVVGGGGNGGSGLVSNSGSGGSNGTQSSFGTSVYAPGGKGGDYGGTPGNSAASGFTTPCEENTAFLKGCEGSIGNTLLTDTTPLAAYCGFVSYGGAGAVYQKGGGGGGCSPFGAGGKGGPSGNGSVKPAAGQVGQGYGCGGGGGGGNYGTVSGGNGGAGKAGIVIVEWND